MKEQFLVKYIYIYINPDITGVFRKLQAGGFEGSLKHHDSPGGAPGSQFWQKAHNSSYVSVMGPDQFTRFLGVITQFFRWQKILSFPSYWMTKFPDFLAVKSNLEKR